MGSGPGRGVFAVIIARETHQGETPIRVWAMSATHWLTDQWLETARKLKGRHATRRGLTVISDDSLASCISKIEAMRKRPAKAKERGSR